MSEVTYRLAHLAWITVVAFNMNRYTSAGPVILWVTFLTLSLWMYDAMVLAR